MKYWIVYSFFKLLSLLPFGILYMLSDIMCFVMKHIVGYRKRIIYKNLRNSFPDKTDLELKSIADEFYRHLCDCIVETVKLLHVSDEEMKRRVEIVNGNLIDRMAEDGKSIVLFIGHYGNWEWVQEVPRSYARPEVSAEIYRHAKNKVFNRLIKRIRSRYSSMQIVQKKAVRTLLDLNNKGAQFIVGFISDQRPNSKNLNHWLTFLNQETAVAVGGEEIGRHIGVHYAYLDIKKVGRGHYCFVFKEMEGRKNKNEDYPMTAEFYRLLEENIKRAPAYWLWSHDRWKFLRQQ
ncbi:MAG: lysophospholipid acyltransferase family protein [Prevotella sp.]